MQEYEANVAAVLLVGPFVAIADGVTPVTNVTLAGADHAELMKHNGTTFVDLTSDSRTWAHKEGGWYNLTLGTGDMDTEGRFKVVIMDTDVFMPVWEEGMILSQAGWASKYDAKDSGHMDVDIKAVGGTATPHTSGKLHVLDDDGASIPTAVEIQAEMEANGASLLDTIRDELANATDGLSALKDLLDTISGYTDLIDDATNGLAAIKAEVEGLGGAAMVGTNGAALASSWTSALATILANFSAARIGYLDQLDFNLQEAIAAIAGDATAANQALLIQILTGKWWVVGNQLIMYDTDRTTPLYTFDLTRDGIPTEFNPDMRTPV